MAIYHGEYVVSYGSISHGHIDSWSAYSTEEDAIVAFNDNCKLGRFAEVYKWEDNIEDYKRIIDVDGERR